MFSSTKQTRKPCFRYVLYAETLFYVLYGEFICGQSVFETMISVFLFQRFCKHLVLKKNDKLFGGIY